MFAEHAYQRQLAPKQIFKIPAETAFTSQSGSHRVIPITRSCTTGLKMPSKAAAH